MNLVSSRIMRFIAVLLGVLMLAGCLAKEVKVDPTRTSAMVTFVVAPKGVDGMATTATNKCTFRAQVSAEKAAEYEANPPKMVEDNICIEFNDQKVRALAQLAVQGNQQLAGEITKSVITVGTGGLVNFAVQRALQHEQGKICAEGGCIQTVNNNVAFGGQGGQGGHGGQGGAAVSVSESGAAASSEVRIEGPCPTCK